MSSPLRMGERSIQEMKHSQNTSFVNLGCETDIGWALVWIRNTQAINNYFMNFVTIEFSCNIMVISYHIPKEIVWF